MHILGAVSGPRASLLRKLLLAVLIPTILTFTGFGVLGHFAAARALEAELGRRLSGIAAVAAQQMSEESVALLAPGDESSRTYRNLRRRLLEIRDAAAVARVYVFAIDLNAPTALVDTDEVPIGTRYYSLDASRAELRSVRGAPDGQGARAASSVLFKGRDGQLYKSGFAPIRGAAGQGIRYAVGVDGSAALYRDLIGLRKTLAGVGGFGVLALVLLSVLLGRRVTLPLGNLTARARAIGQGMLDEPVPAPLQRGGDEVAVLARGLESMRQDLRARDERMQMMLAGIAHEVRNPLGGMELFVGLLREELGAAPAPDETSLGYVARVQKELKHLQAVVSDFLEYARRPRPQLQPARVLDLVREAGESAQATAPPGVRVRIETCDAALTILADTTQLRRALLNLAHNAVQACATEGVVTLSCAPLAGGTRVQIRVTDTGPGIPADVLDKIWTPFFTTRAQGTGLGLAFVREIVADHEGRIAVSTGATGTTFTLELPAAAPR